MSACSGDDDSPSASDGGSTSGSGSGGGGRAGASAGRSGSSAGAAGRAQDGTGILGAPCATDGDCRGGFVCDAEFHYQAQLVGAPNDEIDRVVTPGGSCTPTRRASFDATGAGGSCDPNAAIGSQGCGDKGVCTGIPGVPTTTDYIVVGCRVLCDAKAEGSGCEHSGYTCAVPPNTSQTACVEGCSGDDECRIKIVDEDGDGFGDALAYDSESQQTCGEKTGRCEHPAGGKSNGDSCTRSDECLENGLCLGELEVAAGQTFPGGFCTQERCDLGVTCAGDTVCETLRPWYGLEAYGPACFTRCSVGAEAEADRLGVNGHGQGCREGYRCHYNGGSGEGAGVCVGGEYNAVTTNNVGQSCDKDADCYSPFGLGYCAKYALASGELPGICVLQDCAIPGLPANPCGAGNVCMTSPTEEGGDTTICSHNCKSATECAAGHACTDDDGSPSTEKVCFPICLESADCRSNEQCSMTTGTCVPM